MNTHIETLREIGETVFLAGACVGPGVYLEVETHHRVCLPHATTLPAACDGRVARYRRIDGEAAVGQHPRVAGPSESELRQHFSLLYKRSHAGVYRKVLSGVRNSTDAEDITQEVFARAWAHFDRYDAGRSFDAWVQRIAANLVVDHLRRQQRWRRIRIEPAVLGSGSEYSGDETDWKFIEAPDSTHDPAVRLMAAQLSEALQTAFASLPEAYRQILLMLCQDHSYHDIAEILNCPVGTVRSRVHRARVKLQSLIKDQ